MIKFKDFMMEFIDSKKILKDIENQFEVDLKIYKNSFPHGYLVYKDTQSIAVISSEYITPIGLAYRMSNEDLIDLKGFQNAMMTKELKYIKSSILKHLENNPFSFLRLDFRFRDDEDIALKALEVEISNISDVSDRLKTDYQFAYKAVILGCTIEYFPFNDDEKIALLSIKNKAKAFLMLSDELRNDKKFIYSAMQINPSVYEFLPTKYKQDELLALKALEKDGSFFSILPFELKSNKKLALESLKKNIYAYNIFFEELKNDEDIQYQYDKTIEELHKRIKEKHIICSLNQKYKDTDD